MEDIVQIGNVVFKRGDTVSKIQSDIVYPNNIILPPFCKLLLYDETDFKGNIVTIQNINEMNIRIDLKDIKNNKLKVIKSISIEPAVTEGFSENSVRDICLYTCTNFNYVNLIMCVALIAILYYYFYQI